MKGHDGVFPTSAGFGEHGCARQLGGIFELEPFCLCKADRQVLRHISAREALVAGGRVVLAHVTAPPSKMLARLHDAFVRGTQALNLVLRYGATIDRPTEQIPG